MESAESKLITITDNALAKLKELNTNNEILRIRVAGGGCSGLTYNMEWVGGTNDKDVVDTYGDVTVTIDPKSALFIKGMELSFSDGLDGSGFDFSNPNATRSCGCGSSFSV